MIPPLASELHGRSDVAVREVLEEIVRQTRLVLELNDALDEHATVNPDDLRLCEEAICALGELGGDVAIGFLQQALADERGSIRDAAAEVLAELASEGR